VDITPIRLEAVAAQAGSISFPQLDGDSALISYVTIPSGMRISIHGIEGTIVDVEAVESFIVRSGRVLYVPLVGPQQLAVLLNATDSDSAASSRRSLRNRLLSYTEIGTLTVPRQPGLVTLIDVGIGADGRVQAVNTGSSGLSTAMIAGVKAWRFSPSQASETVRIPIFVGQDGRRLVCELTPGAVSF